jgi:hypothetical protein
MNVNKKVILGLLSIGVLFSGCAIKVQKVGKDTTAATSTFGTTYNISDPKKVRYFLKHFRKKSINKAQGKTIDPKEVLVFSSSYPNDCKKIGYIVVKNSDGFKKVDRKVGVYGSTMKFTNQDELVKDKAAKLGIKAISAVVYHNAMNIKTNTYTIKTKNPYESISYIKMGDVVDGYHNIYKKSAKIEKKCKHSSNYYKCVKNSLNYNDPKSFTSIYFLHAETALKCNNSTIKKLKSGQTGVSIDIENKMKSFFHKK